MENARRLTAQRRIGDAVVTLIDAGGMVWAPKYGVPESEWRAALPDAGPEGEIPISFILAHVQLGDASVMIDPGLDDPGTPWDAHFQRRWHGVYRTGTLGEALAEAGIDRAGVSHVVITHTHGDHIGAVSLEGQDGREPRFPNARYYVGRGDWEGHPQRIDPNSELVERLGPVAAAGKLVLVDDEVEIAPGISLVPSPGESSGHLVVRVRSGGESFYYLGDLFHHGAEVANLDWVSPGRDAATMRASRERVLADAVPANAVVVFSHERFPGWGRIARADDGYRWQLL